MAWNYRRKYKGKRKGGHRRKSKKRQNKVRSAAAPLATQQRLSFKYCEHVSINPPAGGSTGTYVFSANGMFDPNVTGTGHQPLGFDQWIPQFYNHYVVTGAKCTARFVSPTNSVLGGTMICGIEIVDNATPYNLPASAIMERPRTAYRMLGNASTGNSLTTVVKGFSAKKFFRIKDVVGDDTQRGTSTSNPAEQAYFHVWVGALDETTDVASVPITVTIEYTVALLEPNQLDQS